MEQAFVKCAVAKGIFSDEREVTLKTREGSLSFFANKAFVQSPPVEEAPVAGRLRVVIVQRKNGDALVRLPSQASPAANSIWVTRKDLEP